MAFSNLIPRWRDQRNLASAFVGEIVAAMEMVEEHITKQHLYAAGPTKGESLPDFGDFELPRLAVYEANAIRLLLFNAPLPRELSYFYTRLASLPLRLQALKASVNSSEEDLKLQRQSAMGEIDRTMILGEDLLRSMRKIVSRKQPNSTLRA